MTLLDDDERLVAWCRELWLAGNNLSGQIPAGLTHLLHLRYRSTLLQAQHLKRQCASGHAEQRRRSGFGVTCLVPGSCALTATDCQEPFHSCWPLAQPSRTCYALQMRVRPVLAASRVACASGSCLPTTTPCLEVSRHRCGPRHRLRESHRAVRVAAVPRCRKWWCAFGNMTCAQTAAAWRQHLQWSHTLTTCGGRPTLAAPLTVGGLPAVHWQIVSRAGPQHAVLLGTRRR